MIPTNTKSRTACRAPQRLGPVLCGLELLHHGMSTSLPLNLSIRSAPFVALTLVRPLRTFEAELPISANVLKYSIIRILELQNKLGGAVVR